MAKLKPKTCPYCGSIPVVCTVRDGDETKYHVRCLSCTFLDTKQYKLRGWAIGAWNRMVKETMGNVEIVDVRGEEDGAGEGGTV